MQLGGDETAALVGDLGSRCFKFGFAGEDMPRSVIPSAVGQCLTPVTQTSEAATETSEKDVGEKNNAFIVGESGLWGRSEEMELKWAKKQGRISDWDAVETLWEHAIGNCMRSDASKHPLMVTQGTYEAKEDREKLAEIVFERLGSPATFFARNAMLSAFSLGRASALVVDIGASKTCSAAVQDGFVLDKTVKHSPVAGDLLDWHVVELLESKILKEYKKSDNDCRLLPRCAVKACAGQPVDLPEDAERRKRPKMEPKSEQELQRITPSYMEWQKLEVVKDMKTNVCRVWAELGFEESKASIYAKEQYELPDGTIVSLGADRFKSGEILIHPEYDVNFIKKYVAEWDSASASKFSVPGLMKETLQNLHVDLRRDLVQQLILVGGGSLLPGTVERLGKELVQILPSALKPRFLTPGKYEKLFSCFTGGSILATLGSFQQLWISKKEYEEYGTAIISHRCVH